MRGVDLILSGIVFPYGNRHGACLNTGACAEAMDLLIIRSRFRGPIQVGDPWRTSCWRFPKS
jgi:hypothetical protein